MLKKWKNPGLDLMTHKGALGLHVAWVCFVLKIVFIYKYFGKVH